MVNVKSVTRVQIGHRLLLMMANLRWDSTAVLTAEALLRGAGQHGKRHFLLWHGFQFAHFWVHQVASSCRTTINIVHARGTFVGISTGVKTIIVVHGDAICTIGTTSPVPVGDGKQRGSSVLLEVVHLERGQWGRGHLLQVLLLLLGVL